MAFVGLAPDGLQGHRFKQCCLFLDNNCPAMNCITHQVSWLLFDDAGVASHLQDFRFEPFVHANLVAYKRLPYLCPELLQRIFIHAGVFLMFSSMGHHLRIWDRRLEGRAALGESS